MRQVTHLVTHHLPGDVIDHLLLVIPEDAPRWYQQVTSLSWFNERERERVFGKGKEAMTKLAYRGEIEYATTKILCDLERMMYEKMEWEPKLGELPVVRSVWEMYERLGYDYKRKRWAKKEG